MKIELARLDDLAGVVDLLARSESPQAGVEEQLATVLVARDDGRLVGCAALEVYGNAALLRSIAVEPALRGHGVGQQLTRAALDLARRTGIAEVYLLTETAAAFYPRFGFQPISRAEVAAPVQQSVEFTTLCPASSQAMRLALTSE